VVERQEGDLGLEVVKLDGEGDAAAAGGDLFGGVGRRQRGGEARGGGGVDGDVRVAGDGALARASGGCWCRCRCWCMDQHTQ
jgi:hypothetical protein